MKALLRPGSRQLTKWLLSTLLPVLVVVTSCTAKASEALLERALEPFKQIQVLQGQFEQNKKLPFFSNPITSKGTFLSVKNKGLVWETKTPAPSVLIMTPGKVIQKVNGRSQVYKATGTGYDGMAILLPSLLDGDIKQLTAYFKPAISGTESKWTLDLTPANKELTSIIQKVSVTGGNGFFNKLSLTGVSGDLTNIEFHSVSMKREAPNANDLVSFE